MSKNTMIANITTILGTGACLMVASLPLGLSLGILAGTTIGCTYLTIKEGEKGDKNK